MYIYVFINLYAYAYIIYLEFRGFLFLDGLEEDWERESMCWRGLKEKSWKHIQTFKDVVTIIGVSHPNFDPIPSSYWSICILYIYYIYCSYLACWWHVGILDLKGPANPNDWNAFLQLWARSVFFCLIFIVLDVFNPNCLQVLPPHVLVLNVGNGWVAGGCWDDYW